MKKSILVAALIGLTFSVSSMTYGQDINVEGSPTEQVQTADACKNFTEMKEKRKAMKDARKAIRGAMKEKMKAAHLEVLAGLTGQSTDSLQQEMEGVKRRELFEKYNIDREAFHTKMEEKKAQLIEEAVADGTLTTEQASLLKEHTKGGKGGKGMYGKRGHHKGGRHGKGMRGPNKEIFEGLKEEVPGIIAALSGDSVENVQAKLEKNHVLYVLGGYQIDSTEFQTQMKAKTKERIEKAAQDGKISQEQGERMLEHLDQANGKMGFGKRGMHGKSGMRGMHGKSGMRGMHGMRGGMHAERQGEMGKRGHAWMKDCVNTDQVDTNVEQSTQSE